MSRGRTASLVLLTSAVAAAAAAAAVTAVGTGARAGPAPAAARPLPFYYDLYTFRGTADSTLVVAALAVPAGRLERELFARQVRYRFDVTLVLADTALRTVYRTDDSVFVSLPRALGGDQLLSTHVEVQAPPSGSTVQRVIMTDATTPGVGQLYTTEFVVPDYRGSRLMLSDIALSRPDPRSGWRRGAATLALLPTSEFPVSAFDVYYEIYNLPPGNAYTTEVAVERLADASGRPVAADGPVRLRYSGESAARPVGWLQELRHVDASVDDGRYRITVTITDEITGESASRSRMFQVRGWAPGVTLVAARPRGAR